MPKEAICVKGLQNRVLRASILHSGKELLYDVHGGAPWNDIPGILWIYMTEEDCAENTTVVKLELKGKVRLYDGGGAVITNNE